MEEIRSIERLLTTFNEERHTDLVNRSTGMQPLKVDSEIFDLI